MHRAAHAHPWLWSAHLFHHAPDRIYWLNGMRVHPLNVAWHQLSGLFVLMAIGVPAPVVQTVILFGVVISIFQHANADLRYDGWNALLGTADLHRWHHAADARIAHCNFGTVLMVWDHVLGTYRPGAGAPAAVGVEGVDAASVTYLAGLRLSSAEPSQVESADRGRRPSVRPADASLETR
jgi:sterol desaturase/sphingolipid hydroxylase (fatty acid hydroxylase superfamily)